ncbi:MAG: protein kinase [Lentisphaerae bacterium]|nr:protein kinase [Lentisphaerota bacterium]MBT4820694.1 protein kinase [Lentisphaerota bacterium]MBT5610809.1 protein kinase [Lentisphaerota bacterium]MBT7053759.1 protein kinase [Lentisphaerota bacterium]MBT7841220.1 protein kinase [Lentisphaerota bacterium]
MADIGTDRASIIVADDDPLALKMYERILGTRFDVRTCDDGSGVLAEFAFTPARCVILDNNMPGMDGRATTEALRQSALSWNVPIIIVSAEDEESDILDGLSFGADDYLVKPVKGSELLAKITVALRRRSYDGAEATFGPGSIFYGRYQIDRQLGEGGYSRVFRARDLRPQQENPWVALKVIEIPKLTSRERAMSYFLREAYEHSRLDHPNIVKLFDFGHIERFFFLVMEYLEGVTALDRANSVEPVSEPELLFVGHEISEALACLDRHDLIHRDVKPSNIMLCPGDVIKLLDFGLTKNPKEETLNLNEEFHGTPAYMSPEQILNDDVDIRADLYSLGATLYSMATGQQLFGGASAAGVLQMHLSEDPAPVRTLRGDLSKAFSELIDKSLRRRREERPTIGEFQMLCELLMVGSGN